MSEAQSFESTSASLLPRPEIHQESPGDILSNFTFTISLTQTFQKNIRKGCLIDQGING